MTAGNALAGCLVAAFLLAACADGGGDEDVTVGGPAGAELPNGRLVAGNDVGWLIEEQLRSEGEVVESPDPLRVYRIGADGRIVTLPELEPMGIFDTGVSGDRLVVAGARCSDGTLQEDCSGIAEVAVLDPGSQDWRRVEVARGNNLDDLQFVIVSSDDDRAWLLTDYDEAGRKDGAMHVAGLDPSVTRVETWSVGAPASSGGFCAYDDVVHSFTSSGGFMAPEQPGLGVLQPVPVSYQIYAYENGTWQPTANGAWSGTRARGESMTCSDQGLVARVPDGSTGFLRWTPSRGWVELPAPATADQVPLGLDDGHMVGIRDGQVVVERTPGDARPIPGVRGDRAAASGPTLLPPLAVSQTTVVACQRIREGDPASGMNTSGLRYCTVADRP